MTAVVSNRAIAMVRLIGGRIMAFARPEQVDYTMRCVGMQYGLQRSREAWSWWQVTCCARNSYDIYSSPSQLSEKRLRLAGYAYLKVIIASAANL